MADSVPDEFRPTNIMAKRNAPEFKDLRGHELSKATKTWFCEQLIKVESKALDRFFIDASQNQIIDRYNLARGTVRGWLAAHRNGKMHDGNEGRPMKIDDIGLNNICALVEAGSSAPGKGKDKKRKFDGVGLRVLFAQEVQHTKNRSGYRVHEEEGEQLSEKTFKKYLNVRSTHCHLIFTDHITSINRGLLLI